MASQFSNADRSVSPDDEHTSSLLKSRIEMEHSSEKSAAISFIKASLRSSLACVQPVRTAGIRRIIAAVIIFLYGIYFSPYKHCGRK